MSVTRTKRFKLYSESDTELIDQFYLNWPIIDDVAGPIVTTGDATPPDAELYDGCLVVDDTTGKQWIAKQNPETLAFTKEWMIYPWNIQCSGSGTVTSTSGAANPFNLSTFQSGVNATASALVAGHIIVPIKAIYEINLNVKWQGSPGQARVAYIGYNDGTESNVYSEHMTFGNSDGGVNSCTMFKWMDAGDKLNAYMWQNAGSNQTMNMYMNVTLLSPL